MKYVNEEKLYSLCFQVVTGLDLRRYNIWAKFSEIIVFIDHFFVDRLVKAKSTMKKQQLPPLPGISKSDLEDALFELQLQYNCCVHFCESADDLAQMVCSFTRAVAERPYK